MSRAYISEGGDRCDSDSERVVINDLIERGVPYIHHPDPYEYSRHVRGGYCLDCDSNNVRKGALYSPDILLVDSGILIEIKGGSTTPASRGRLTDFAKYRTDLDLRFLFRDNRKIFRGSKSRHLDFAAKLDCIAALGMRVPEEWLL